MQPTPKYEEAELVEAIRSGNGIDGALEFIYENYYGLLEHQVMSNSGTADDAADVIQDALVGLIDMIQKDKYRGDASVKSMLFTLTRNLWISELRKRGSSSKRLAWFENERETSERDVSDYLAYQEGRQLIVELLDRLGETCQRILTLFYYENLSMREIMPQLKFSSEQVLRNKKYKCLKELIAMVQRSPTLRENVKNALQHVRY